MATPLTWGRGHWQTGIVPPARGALFRGGTPGRGARATTPAPPAPPQSLNSSYRPPPSALCKARINSPLPKSNFFEHTFLHSATLGTATFLPSVNLLKEIKIFFDSSLSSWPFPAAPRTPGLWLTFCRCDFLLYTDVRSGKKLFFVCYNGIIAHELKQRTSFETNIVSLY